MNVPTKLAAFAGVLGLTFGVALAAGALIDPTDEPPAGDHADGGAAHSSEGGDQHRDQLPGGLAVSANGYALEVDRALYSPGQPAPFTFRITDDRGRTIRGAFELEHDKELHLVVVRRDTAVFEHVHPVKGDDGTWSIDLNLPAPGTYRAFADFKIGDDRQTLATDLFVGGDFQPRVLPDPRSTARALDASGRSSEFDVTLSAPGTGAARETGLSFAVARSGLPFDGLEPYLGAKGHLVALREGDLAYLHVHPTAAHGNEINFAATFPTPGRYRLFLQFQTGGEVRTASYTLEVPR
ncbi:MAG: hypothetical protein ACRD12_08365 [Acidimicrobiales bacterium]